MPERYIPPEERADWLYEPDADISLLSEQQLHEIETGYADSGKQELQHPQLKELQGEQLCVLNRGICTVLYVDTEARAAFVRFEGTDEAEPIDLTDLIGPDYFTQV